MKNKIRFVAAVIVACLIAGAILPIPQTSAQRTITVEDSLGHEVELPYPIERLVTLTPVALEVAWALGAENRVVGIDQFSKWNDEFFLAFRDKPSVGLPPLPNYEKIIDLNPQVVIAFASPPLGYPKLENRLEVAGIKVVRLNFHDPKTYDREVKAFGQMLGRKKRAEEFLNFSGSWVNEIEERVKNIPLGERVRVYYEWIEPYTIYGKEAGPSQLITMAGGVDVASEVEITSSYSPFPFAPTAGFFLSISGESIVEEDPQVILKDLMNLLDIVFFGRMAPKTIGYTSKPDIRRMEEARDEIMNRAGFGGMDAVKNGDVYIFAPSPEFAMSPRWPVALGYIAKRCYPDRFEDIAPESFHKEWLERWYGLEYKGVFVYPEE